MHTFNSNTTQPTSMFLIPFHPFCSYMVLRKDIQEINSDCPPKTDAGLKPGELKSKSFWSCMREAQLITESVGGSALPTLGRKGSQRGLLSQIPFEVLVAFSSQRQPFLLQSSCNYHGKPEINSFVWVWYSPVVDCDHLCVAKRASAAELSCDSSPPVTLWLNAPVTIWRCKHSWQAAVLPPHVKSLL